MILIVYPDYLHMGGAHLGGPYLGTYNQKKVIWKREAEMGSGTEDTLNLKGVNCTIIEQKARSILIPYVCMVACH